MGKLVLARMRQRPRLAGWLVVGDNCTHLGLDTVVRSADDDGTLERPLGSNWGGRVTSIIERWGRHKPEYWCADWAMGVLADVGAMIPVNGESCDEWMPHMVPWKDVAPIDRAGSLVLFGKPGDTKHIAIVTRYERDIILTREGNRGYTALATNNGVGVDQSPLTRKDILGVYVPRSGYASDAERVRAMRAAGNVYCATCVTIGNTLAPAR